MKMIHIYKLELDISLNLGKFAEFFIKFFVLS